MILSKLQQYIIAGTALAAVLGLVAVKVVSWYNTNIQDAYNSGRQEIVDITKDIEIKSYRDQLEDNKRELTSLAETIERKQKEVNSLERKLQIEHDLDRLLQAKPNLILKRVNAGTAEVLLEIEEATK